MLFKVVTICDREVQEVEGEGKSVISLQSGAVCLVMFPMEWASYILITQKANKQKESHSKESLWADGT